MRRGSETAEGPIFINGIEIRIPGPPGDPRPQRFALQECGTEGEDPDEREPGPLPPQRQLESQAMRWSYVLRSRERWLSQSGAAQGHEEDAAETLREFGLDDRAQALIAAAPLVVVWMPYSQEAEGWAGRIFPWEFVIAAATRRFRRSQDQPCTVMRELAPAGQRAAARRPGRKLRMLFVQSAPGGLRQAEDFAPERERMQDALDGGAFQTLVDPTLAQLRDKVAEMRPDLIHLSGFGNASGLREWRELAAPREEYELVETADEIPRRRARDSKIVVPDGMLLAGESTSVALVGAQALVRALSADGQHCAYFIGASLESSAARTAALMVAEGACLAAVGFQDRVDPALLDFFFELFYGQLEVLPRNAQWAFQGAWLRARQEPGATRATGIAFWGGEPLIDPGTPFLPAGPAELRKTNRLPSVSFKHADDLNYAVLHNGESLFRELTVLRGKADKEDWLSLDVELHVGAEPARFSHRFQADRSRFDLSRQAVLPLTAALMRSSREAVNSTVVVALSWKNELLSRETRRLRLLPVDMWRDNSKDGQWLPSFVLPRDAAVMKAVEQAQRYVRVLRDNPAAGFEGYQAAPGAEEAELCEVDLQVQAIWATLLHDWQLGYINPPPSYSKDLDSQRLRTPSTVLGNRSGTCIDLALLFAACLELVDIYPVIFLLKGHALPGYWRHDSFREAYLAMRSNALPEPERGGGPPAARAGGSVQVYAWQARGEAAYPEIRRLIESRQLVPLETVRLTEHCGFVEAIEAGVGALVEPGDFDSLLDIVTARSSGVTPLPIYPSPV